MEEIEKLDRVISGVGDFEKLVCKINEIIDVLNQKQPEVSREYLERTDYTDYPRVTTTEVETVIGKWSKKRNKEEEPTEKQEDKITAGDVFQLKRLEESAKDYKKLKESMDKLEKQEEWREEICEMILSYAYDYHWNLEGWGAKTRIPTEEDLEKVLRDIVGRIDKLLSERTFTKEELKRIKRWKEMVESKWGDCVDDYGLKKKISKLLKEEE